MEQNGWICLLAGILWWYAGILLWFVLEFGEDEIDEIEEDDNANNNHSEQYKWL